MFFDCQGDVEQVEALADGGADVNQPGHSDVTSLHIAAMCGHLEASALSICHGISAVCLGIMHNSDNRTCW